MTRFKIQSAMALAAVLLAGCSDDMDIGGTPDGGTSAAGIVGAFQVTLKAAAGAAPAYTQLFGKVYDGPTPVGTLWETKLTEGGCKLLTPKIPFCATPCGGSALCVADGKCQSYPSALSVGTVKVQGFRTSTGATSFSMDPVAGNYQPVGVTLAHPPCAEGAEVALSSTSPALTVKAQGISELKLTSSQINMEDGEPATLTWTKPALTASARIKVKLDISHHGGTKGKIACDLEDSGSLTLSAAMLDGLKKLGVAGFPTVIVTREAKGTAAGADLTLKISSGVEQSVKIPGLVSCSKDTDCPTGQKCQTDRRCK